MATNTLTHYVTINLGPLEIAYSKAADELTAIARDFECGTASLLQLTAAADKLVKAKKAFLAPYKAPRR